MEHYITEIKIEQLRHLSNIVISLDTKARQHLIITGKNGSGKTSLLLAFQKHLDFTTNLFCGSLLRVEKELQNIKAEEKKMEVIRKYYGSRESFDACRNGLYLFFNNWENIEQLFRQGDFVTAFFPAERKTQIIRGNGVEDVKLQDHYDINSRPGQLLHKYMVHLKTQQAYARNEGDMPNVDRIQKWFDRFEDALQVLLDDNSIKLEYDYKEYDFKIHQNGRKPFNLEELSDGYSAVIHIVSDLILRMDKNWLLRNSLSEYNIEGIVMIDELETHLHIELQKKILPFLTAFFPRIQFIVTTHSPYILNSISNAKAYDLEKCVELENLSLYSADSLAEGYFDADEYSNALKEKIARYEHLAAEKNPTEEERAERAQLRSELRGIPKALSQEAWDKFMEIEGKRL